MLYFFKKISDHIRQFIKLNFLPKFIFLAQSGSEIEDFE